MEKSTMLKLFGYDNYMAGLETREAIEFYKAIKLGLDNMSKAALLSQKLEELNMAGMPKTDDHGDNQQRICGEIEEIEVEAETNLRKFKNFDILEFPPPDHRFLCLKNFAKLFSGPNRSLEVKICREWEILKAELPGSVFFVRVYKSRFDLMRVAMIDEEAATSYNHHGLFFFDLRFPRDYPSKPTKLYYHSYGELHPFHKGIFKNWQKRIQSSEDPPIINLFVLLQRFVSSLSPNLNQEKRKINCDKDVMMRASGAILHMLRSPLKGFEVFVEGYFLMRAHYILLTYKAFMDPEDRELNRFFFKLVNALEKN